MEYLYPWVYLFLHPQLTWICSALFSISSAFYNWWRQRKHKRETKDESHLHMVIVSVFTFDLSFISAMKMFARFQSWEQDYHLQDPGRLALFDEYLEMSKKYFSRVPSIIFWHCLFFPFLKSHPVRLRDAVRCRFSISTTVCIDVSCLQINSRMRSAFEKQKQHRFATKFMLDWREAFNQTLLAEPNLESTFWELIFEPEMFIYPRTR